MTDVSTVVGSAGVGLLLVAFFLNLFKLTSQDSKLYVVMNMIGAALSCYASFLIGFIPFVVLEGTWSVVAAIAMVKLLRR
jgi:hypothetical protein